LFAEWLSGAARVSLAQLAGPELPVQALLTFGGGTVMRGLPRERYLDRSLLYFNAELRAVVVWRFSMIAGFDGGRVWRSLAHAGFADWTAAPVLGLRLDMRDFIIRGDVGFGSEGLGVFLNFGHVF
jgi:hemolysin activation/secretion protein